MNELCVTRVPSVTCGGLQSSSRLNLSALNSATTNIVTTIIKKPRKHEQRLLRNVGVHTVVLDLLQVPYDRKGDRRMDELMELAHEFLQSFCLGNPQNQHLLHAHLDLFLNPEVNFFFYRNQIQLLINSIIKIDSRCTYCMCYI